MAVKPFVINRYGRMVFPCNFFPELDFSVFHTLQQFNAVIRRDFGEKAPTEAEIVARVENGQYKNRYEVCRDMALNLFWAQRYVLTMYEKRPTRWGDLPRNRSDIFLGLYKPRDFAGPTAAIEAGYVKLPAMWDEETEDKSFRMLMDVLRNKQGSGGEFRALRPTVAEILTNPSNRTYRLLSYDRDYPGYDYDDVIDCIHTIPELEALMRQAMILHNQYRWDPATSTSTEVGKLQDDDYVVAFHPRNSDVTEFLRRVKRNGNSVHRPKPERPATLALSEPEKPYPPVIVRDTFTVMPRIEAIAVYEGEIPCTNQDLISNHAYCWSRMSAADVSEKTGIESRCYSELSLEDMALLAVRAALTKSGRKPSEIGAVLFCSCTSTTLIPSVATWLSGELGLRQTHNSCDIVAACAGMSYGLAEATRLLQEVRRPVIVVCAEKFSDKIGTVRTSRMIFGDGAAAMVVGPAPEGALPDIEVFQTYASGPWSEVNSIIWPNPEFDNNITVYGPEVKMLAKRYLVQMIGELKSLPRPDGGAGTLMDSLDLVVPHQANKNMVLDLAKAAGVAPEQLYFNIDRVGNTSSASILLAIHDAVREGRIDRPMRVFAPGFGAGAVGGYVVMRVDPAVVHCNSQERNISMENNGDNGNGNGSHAGSLKGKVALVTGAGRGIGRAIAIELARRGANVALDYRSDAPHAASACEEIRQLGVECITIQGDVSKKGEAQRIVKEVLDKWQRLDILVNNAGITRDRSMRKMTDDDWAEVINVNLNGTFYCTSAALPAMINQRFGRIINISSVVGQMGAFGQANYSASKGGIIAFTKTLALEMAKFNITANAIAPGFTSTEMVDAIPEEIAAQIKAKIPLGRFASVEEIAKAAGFLATDADYITGQELNVNGGYHM
ncbi:MAG: 3-oxoacyl-[acyl-carrier-protein] reductase [Terriglobales bacterium]